jgi:hypothetical protein
LECFNQNLPRKDCIAIKIAQVIAVLIPTKATAGTTANTVFPITGNDPKNNCAASNATKGPVELFSSSTMDKD